MASKEIPQLPDAAAADGSEWVHIVQGGNSRRLTIAGLVAILVGAAPATLDTLMELADSIGDDPNFAATMLAALAGKASNGDLQAVIDDLATTITALDGLQTQVDALAPIATRYSYGFSAAATITASEILLDHIVVQAHTIPANFAGSRASVGTPPAATFVLTVQNNGVTIGTISIDVAGVVTFATVGGTAKAIAAGDVITVIGPAGADAAIARLRATIKGI